MKFKKKIKQEFKSQKNWCLLHLHHWLVLECEKGELFQKNTSNVGQINWPGEKHISMLTKLLRIMNGLLYIQLTDPTNLLTAIDIIIILYRNSLRPENYAKGFPGLKRLEMAVLIFFSSFIIFPAMYNFQIKLNICRAGTCSVASVVYDSLWRYRL